MWGTSIYFLTIEHLHLLSEFMRTEKPFGVAQIPKRSIQATEIRYMFFSVVI